MDDNTKEVGLAKQEVEGDKPLNILLVEDEEGIKDIIKTVLEGHNITSFTNAEDAVAALKKAKENGSSFNWVITDNGLEGKMNGFDLAGLIKNEKFGNPFVTMVTGSAQTIIQENTEIELKNKGIDQLMGKPFNINELTDSVDVVRKFIKQSQDPQA